MKRQSDGATPAPKRWKKKYDTGGYVCEFVVESTEIDGDIWKKVPDTLAPGNNTYVSNLGRTKSRRVTRSENIQHSHADPDRKSNGPKQSKKVRCQKIGTTEWLVFPSTHEVACGLGLRQRDISRCCRKNALPQE